MNLLFSCSVKEDRKLCPCTLVVKVAAAPEGVSPTDSMAVFVLGEADFRWQTKLAAESLPCTIAVGVPKGSATVTAVLPAESAVAPGEIAIQYGLGCPSVWIDGEVVDTDRNMAVSKLSLHKNWCEIRIRLVFPDALASQSYSLKVSGIVSGYAPGAVPVQGPFGADCSTVVGDYSIVRVPRQMDNSLRLEVEVPAGTLSGQSLDAKDSKVLRVFAIGEYIAESGYDWTLPDLDDVELTLDIACSRLIISRVLWPEPAVFEVVI